MTETEVREQIERLESVVLWTRPKYWQKGDDDVCVSTKHKAIIDLLSLHCRYPGLDPDSAKWVGRQLDALSEAYFSGRTNSLVQLNRGDSRTAFTRNARCPVNGLTWPAAVLLHYETLPQGARLRGDDIFRRIARLVPFSASKVRAMYYETRANPVYVKELADFYARYGYPKNRESLRKN